MTSIILYHYPGASSTFPFLLLEYCGLPYDLKISNPSDPDFAATNPKKQVPVLVIDEDKITENPAIVHAINQLAPSKHIFGHTPIEFVRVCEWLNWISATVHAQAWGSYIRPWRFTNEPTAEAGIKAAAKQKLFGHWETIESKLRDDGAWAVGDDFTAVDAFLFQFFQLPKDRMGLEVERDYPRWTKLVNRMRQMESTKKVIETNDRLLKEMGMLNIR